MCGKCLEDKVRQREEEIKNFVKNPTPPSQHQFMVASVHNWFLSTQCPKCSLPKEKLMMVCGTCLDVKLRHREEKVKASLKKDEPIFCTQHNIAWCNSEYCEKQIEHFRSLRQTFSECL